MNRHKPDYRNEFWERFVGRTVVIEYRAWTGLVKFLAYYNAGPNIWLKLETLSGHAVYAHSHLIDTIRDPITEDYVGEAGLTLLSLAGMRADDRGYQEPPSEDGGNDRETSNTTR